jgi:hypothetical protein
MLRRVKVCSSRRAGNTITKQARSTAAGSLSAQHSRLSAGVPVLTHPCTLGAQGAFSSLIKYGTVLGDAKHRQRDAPWLPREVALWNFCATRLAEAHGESLGVVFAGGGYRGSPAASLNPDHCLHLPQPVSLQEDAHIAQEIKDDCHIFGVFDGHGGPGRPRWRVLAAPAQPCPCRSDCHLEACVL